MCETGSHSSFATTRLPASHNTTCACGGPHFFMRHGFQVWLTFCGVEPLYHRLFPSASSATDQCQICRKCMLKNLDRIVLFPFQDHDGLDLHIGISPLGLTVYHNRCKINFFPWYVNIFCISRTTTVCGSEIMQLYQTLCSMIHCPTKVIQSWFLICRSKVVKVCFKRKRFFVQIRPDWVRILCTKKNRYLNNVPFPIDYRKYL